MAIDVSREIRRAVDTGKAVFGSKQSEKSLLQGKAQIVILGNNTPKEVREKVVNLAEVVGTPCHDFNGTGLALGSVCGKPFVISVMAIEKAGKSKILDVVKKK